MEVSEMLEVMRNVRLCMLEAAEGTLCLWRCWRRRRWWRWCCKRVDVEA